MVPKFDFFVVAFNGGVFERIVETPTFYAMQNGDVGIGIKKRIFRSRRTNEYVFIETSETSEPKHNCQKYGPYFKVTKDIKFDDEERRTIKHLISEVTDKNTVTRLIRIDEGKGAPKKKIPLHQYAKINPKQTADKLLPRIPDLEEHKLLQMWKNACAMENDETKPLDFRKAANKLLIAIGNEWFRRGSMKNPEEYFCWPSTEAIKGNGKLSQFTNLDEGMLSYLGYHVGVTRGVHTSERRNILDRAFAGHLPPVFSPIHMREWSEPSSAARLKKLAECIASFARNTKRRENDTLEQAIKEWEQDLNYLFEKYYMGKFRFAWPSTSGGI